MQNRPFGRRWYLGKSTSEAGTRIRTSKFTNCCMHSQRQVRTRLNGVASLPSPSRPEVMELTQRVVEMAMKVDQHTSPVSRPPTRVSMVWSQPMWVAGNRRNAWSRMTAQIKRDFRRRYDVGRRMIARDSVEDRLTGNNRDQTCLANDRRP